MMYDRSMLPLFVVFGLSETIPSSPGFEIYLEISSPNFLPSFFISCFTTGTVWFLR